MTLERREEDRYESELLVHLATVEFVSNVTTEAYLLNCGRDGAFLVSPLYFKDGERILINIDMLGGPLQLSAEVLNCQEDNLEKFRFDQTFALRVAFVGMSDTDWKQLLIAIGK